MPHRFSVTIQKIGINPLVEVPLRVSRAIGKSGYVPVAGTLNGKPFRATLVPTGGGRHRLFINGEMRRGARVDVTDRITVVLRIDPRPRVIPMPRRLSGELRTNRNASNRWKKLTPSRRKEILRYLNSAKHVKTLDRNVKKVIAMLTEKKPAKKRLGGIRL